MPSQQTLTSFYNSIQKYGFTRDFQARVDNLVINGTPFDISGEDSLLYIKNFSLPSMKKAITTVKYFGVDVHSVGTRDFGSSKDWDVTFYLDGNSQFKYWLERRLVETSSNNISNSLNSIESSNIATQLANFNPIPNAEDNYALISVYDDQLNPVTSYEINGLFIIDIPSVGYSLDGTGKIQEIKVKFGYQNWNYATGTTPELLPGDQQ